MAAGILAQRKVNAAASLFRFLAVLLVGGGIFSLAERSTEVQQRIELSRFLHRMHGALNETDFHELLKWIGKDDRVGEELARANLTSTSSSNVFAPYDWDFVGACSCLERLRLCFARVWRVVATSSI